MLTVRHYRAGFLSPPSARRATISGTFDDYSIPISIPALREEGDQIITLPFQFIWQFLSPPSARRATDGTVPAGRCRTISIPALREEGDRYYASVDYAGGVFLSPPSARRATGIRLGYKATVKFLSPPSARRATTERPAIGRHGKNFYPRPPRGGRPCLTS